jgi:hypothetical protein
MLGAWILTVVGIAVTVVVVLCGRGRIPRNPFVGMRIPAFFSSEEAWRIGHHAVILPVLVSTIGCAVVSVIALELPPGDGTTVTLINAGLLLAGTIVGAVLGSRAIRRDVRADAPAPD